MEETKIELQLIKLSEIQSQEVSWLWVPFIPYGKLTIIMRRYAGESRRNYFMR